MRLRFTNPWWVVVGAVTGLFVCNGPVLGFTFGVFLKPIMADTGWSRGSVSFALSVGGIFSAVAVPILGRMMDRWSIRRVALPGLVVYAVCLGLVGLSPPMFWIFTVMFVLAETTSAIQTPLGYAKAISAWFDARRGLALGIAMAGVGFGGSVIPQLANFLIERIGWRGAYASLAVLTLAIAFPAVALWIREPRPGEGERHFPVSSAGLPGLTIREAARRSRFWILAAVFFLVAIAINGTVAHVIPLLTDRGFSRGTATAIFGLFGLATLAGRLLAGYMVDRIFAPYVASVFFLAPIAGLVFLVSAAGPLPAVGVVLFGLGLGTEIDLIALSGVALFWTARLWRALRVFLHGVRFGLERRTGYRRLRLRPDPVLQRRLPRRRGRAYRRGASDKPAWTLCLPSASPYRARFYPRTGGALSAVGPGRRRRKCHSG
jgi:predicted MFS family arabinose efflux permease